MDSQCTKVDAVRFYTSYRSNLLLRKGRGAWIGTFFTQIEFVESIYLYCFHLTYYNWIHITGRYLYLQIIFSVKERDKNAIIKWLIITVFVRAIFSVHVFQPKQYQGLPDHQTPGQRHLQKKYINTIQKFLIKNIEL